MTHFGARITTSKKNGRVVFFVTRTVKSGTKQNSPHKVAKGKIAFKEVVTRTGSHWKVKLAEAIDRACEDARDLV